MEGDYETLLDYQRHLYGERDAINREIEVIDRQLKEMEAERDIRGDWYEKA